MSEIKMNGDVTLVCNQCECSLPVPLSSFEPMDAYGDESQMGADIGHVYSYDATCPNCDADLQATITVHEYPTGCLNTVIKEGDNCTIQESENEIQSCIEIMMD